MGKGKGYVFSAEAMLAVIVFILFFTVIVNQFLGTTELVFSRVGMKRIGIDVLDSLDEIDALESLDSAIIKEKIDKALPERLSWQLIITQYSLASGSFTKKKEITIGDAADSAGKDVVKAKRLFLTFSAGQIDRYNTAEMWVWLR